MNTSRWFNADAWILTRTCWGLATGRGITVTGQGSNLLVVETNEVGDTGKVGGCRRNEVEHGHVPPRIVQLRATKPNQACKAGYSGV